MSEVKTNKISSLTSSNSDITLDPDGTGDLIVASGNVGIGTSSPSNLLTLQSSGSTKLNIRHTASGNDYGYIFRTTGATTNDLIVESEVNGTGTERMRIDQSGKVLVNTSDDTADSIMTLAYTTYPLAIWNNGGTSGYFGQIRFRNNANTSNIGTIIRTNDASVSYNTTSDYRAKENVADMTGAIDRVKQLAPKRFNFIADTSRRVDGFLAHEAQDVVPEAVHGTHNEVDDDGNAVMQGIDQSKLVPLLTGALKEAIAKIEALEARVTALEDA